MKVEPRWDQVLIEKVLEEKSEGGIVLLHGDKPTIMAQKGKVLAMGPGVLTDEFKRKPIEGLAVGDTVMFNAYPQGVECDLGKDAKGNKVKGWLIAERQVVGVLRG